MKSRKTVVGASTLLAVWALSTQTGGATKKGTWRWSVKTLQDVSASQIKQSAFDNPISLTIADANKFRPATTPSAGMISMPRGKAGPEEFQVYRVSGVAKEIK